MSTPYAPPSRDCLATLLCASVLLVLGSLAPSAIAGEFREGFDRYAPWETEYDDADPGGLWYQEHEIQHDAFRIDVNDSPAPWITSIADPNHLLTLGGLDQWVPMSSEMEVPLGIVPVDGHALLMVDVGVVGSDKLLVRLTLATGESFWHAERVATVFFQGFAGTSLVWARILEPVSDTSLTLFPMVAGRWYRSFIRVESGSTTPVSAGVGERSTAVSAHCITDDQANFDALSLEGDFHLYLHPNADFLDESFVVHSISTHQICIDPQLVADLTDLASPGDIFLLARHNLESRSGPEDIEFGDTNPVVAKFTLSSDPGSSWARFDDMTSNANPDRYTLPFADGVNLIVNPGFEVDDDGSPIGWEMSGGAVRDDAISHSGEASLRIETTGTEGLVAAQTATLMPINHFYDFEIEAWINRGAGTCDPYLAVEYLYEEFTDYNSPVQLSSLGTYEVSMPNVGTGRWVHVSGTPGEGEIMPDIVPEYARPMVGLRCSNQASDRIWFDDLAFDGLGVDPVRLAVPDVGFHARGSKEATVSLLQPTSGGEWRVYNPDDRLLGRGQLELRSEQGPWGRHHARANFTGVTALRNPGSYRLEVETDEGDSAEWTFDVYDRLYERLAELERYYIRGSRCGVATDFHRACHPDDRADGDPLLRFWNYPDEPDGLGPVDESLEGGWHDAGDYGKYIHLYGPAIAILAGLAEFRVTDDVVLPDTNAAIADDSDPWLLALDETRWGVEWILRNIRDDAADCSFREQYWGEVKELCRFVSPDELTTTRYVWGFNFGMDENVGDQRTPIFVAYGLARYAWLLDQLGGWSSRAAEARSEALVQYGCFEHFVGEPGSERWFVRARNVLGTRPRQLLAAIYLYTGLPDEAPERARLRNDIEAVWNILDADLTEGWAQAREGCFEYGFYQPDYQMEFWYGTNSIGKLMPLLIVDALGAYIDLILEPEEDDETKRAALEHLERIGQAIYDNSDRSIWGHNTEIAPDERGQEHRQFTRVDRPGHYTTTYDIAVSAALAQIARRLERRDFLAAAERNLQWVLGRNPMNMTYIGGLRGNMGASFTFLAAQDVDPAGRFVPNIPDEVAGLPLHGPFVANGVLPGGIIKGIHPGESVAIGDQRRASPADFPVSFGVTNYPTSGGNGTAEMWMFFVLQAVRAGTELERAFDELGELPPLYNTNGFVLPEEPGEVDGESGPDSGNDTGTNDLDMSADIVREDVSGDQDINADIEPTDATQPMDGSSQSTDDDGCSCAASHGASAIWPLWLFVALALIRRRA